MKKKVGIIVLVIISIMLIGGIAYNVYARYMLSKRVSISINTSDYYFEIEPEQTEITTFPTTLNVKIKNYENNYFTDSNLNYTLQATGNDFVDIQVSENKGTLKGGSKQEKTFTVTIDKKDNVDYLVDDIQLKFNIINPYTDTKNIIVKTKNTSDDVLVDLSGNGNHGIVNGSKVDDEKITLDGVDDYIDCGLANYDFGDSITMVINAKFESINENNSIAEFFGNWEAAGGEIGYNMNTKLLYGTLYINERNAYCQVVYNVEDISFLTEQYNTFILTYDGKVEKLYINGKEVDSIALEGNIKPSKVDMAIGTNLASTGPNLKKMTNLSVKNAMIFDRAITEEEVKQYSQDTFEVENKESLLFWYNLKEQ